MGNKVPKELGSEKLKEFYLLFSDDDLQNKLEKPIATKLLEKIFKQYNLPTKIEKRV